MAWTTPITYTTLDVISASTLNAQVRDNLSYLYSGRPVVGYQSVNVGWSTTSTSWVDIDGTNLSKSVVTTSGRLAIFFQSPASTTNNGFNGTISVFRDSTNIGDASYGIHNQLANSVAWVSYMNVISPGVGTYTIHLKWQVANAAETMSMGNITNFNAPTSFWIWEL